MPRARDFLTRFRPVGTPGAAASAGVPADRVAEADAELEPLFAMLADTEAEVGRIRASADQRIAESHRLAAERVTEVLAQARLSADAERADASGRARAVANQEIAHQLAAATAQAARVRQSANDQMDAQVAEMVAAVRERLARLERP
jgi:F0F1-type ATP synthase membrane subunit b/b'